MGACHPSYHPTLTRTKPGREWPPPRPAGTFVHHRGARFWLLQSGHVCLDLHVPGQGQMKIDTIGMGELLGWSWLFPPYRWAFGAVAASPVEAFEFDARAVRARCESDPVLGYEVTRRLALVVAKRLKATRVRLITASSPSAISR